MTRRILFTRRNWMQEAGASLSGGVWQPDSPLANLLDYRPQVVAEAVENRDWGSTQFTVDLGVQRKVGLFSFANLRATSSAILILQAGTDPTFASNAYSTTTSARPVDSPTDDYDAWGIYGHGLMYADEYGALGLPRILIPDPPIDCRYIKVQIRDNTNPDPLQIGHFGAWLVWEPPVNFAYDWSLTPVDEADIATVPGGTTNITGRGMRRRLSLGFQYQDESEVRDRSLGLVLRTGKSTPLVIVPFSDPTQIAVFEKFAVYGLLSQDSEISNPFFGFYRVPFQIDQLR